MSATILPQICRFLSSRIILQLVCAAVILSFTIKSCPASDEILPEVRKIADGIEKSQQAFLKLNGGVKIQYHFEAKQDPKKPLMVFQNGASGTLIIKWPEILNRIDGERSDVRVQDPTTHTWKNTSMSVVSDAVYNFETKVAVARDGDMRGQIAAFRDPITSVACLPLTMQYYVEVSQQYVLGEKLKTDQWMPNALEQFPYTIVGKEEIEGIQCTKLARLNLDTVWIAQQQSYTICKRELKFGSGKGIRERTICKNLKEIAPGIWFPEKMSQELHDDNKTNDLLAEIFVTATDIKVGSVKDTDVHISLDNKIGSIEDSTSGTFMRNGGGDLKNRLGNSISDGIRSMELQHSGSPKVLIYWNIVIVLAILIFVLRKRFTIANSRTV